MIDLLPNSRFYYGVYAAIEGLALWVVAIFLATYHATGSFVRSDMYTSIVEAMSAWRAAGAVGLYELLGYAGLTLAVAGPLWMWAGKPLYERYSDSGRGVPSTVSHLEDHVAGDAWAPGDWGSLVEASGLTDQTQESERDSASDDIVVSRDPIQARLADGDFFRGGGGNGEDNPPGSSSGESSST